MPLLSKVGSFQTGTGTSNIPVTGVGFQPKAVIFYGSKQSGDGQTAHAHMCIGFAVSATSRGCVRTRSQDNVATSSASNIVRNDACWTAELDSGTVSGILDFISMDSDGFTVIPDDGFFSDTRIFYLALGGSSLTNAEIIISALTSGTGTQSFGGLAFQPDTVLALWANNSSFNVSSASGSIGFGCARSSTSHGAVVALSESSVNPSDTRSLLTDGSFMYWPSPTSDAGRIDVDFSAFTSDGLTIDKITTDNSLQKVIFLCLKGIDAKIGTVAAGTSVGPSQVSGTGFKPTAVIIASTNNTTTSQTTPTAPAEFMFGAASGATARGSCWIVDGDNISPTDNQNRNDSGALWIDYEGPTGFAIQGEAELQTFDSNGFTLDVVDAFPAANLALYLALGPAAAAAPAGKVRIVGALA